MFRRPINNVVDFAAYEKKVGEEHKHIASTLRKKSAYQSMETLTVQDLSFFPQSNEHPIMFDDIYIREDSKRQSKNLPKATQLQKSFALNFIH